MRSFVISAPGKLAAVDRTATVEKRAGRPNRVLVFLHGVGEAFTPELKEGRLTAESLRAVGLQRLYHHGLPKILVTPEAHAVAGNPPGQPAASLPLFLDFVIIAPQTLLREDMADEATRLGMMSDVVALAKAIAGEDITMALMGFSRGGYAAVHLANRFPIVKAVVTMDAAAKTVDELGAFQKAVDEMKAPCWMFHADYNGVPDDTDWKHKITAFHREKIKADEVPDASSPPMVAAAPGTKFRTQIGAKGKRVDTHVHVCNTACARKDVYEWLDKQLER